MRNHGGAERRERSFRAGKQSISHYSSNHERQSRDDQHDVDDPGELPIRKPSVERRAKDGPKKRAEHAEQNLPVIRGFKIVNAKIGRQASVLIPKSA